MTDSDVREWLKQNNLENIKDAFNKVPSEEFKDEILNYLYLYDYIPMPDEEALDCI
jgi:hypothetical protein